MLILKSIGHEDQLIGNIAQLYCASAVIKTHSLFIPASQFVTVCRLWAWKICYLETAFSGTRYLQTNNELATITLIISITYLPKWINYKFHEHNSRLSVNNWLQASKMLVATQNLMHLRKPPERIWVEQLSDSYGRVFLPCLW